MTSGAGEIVRLEQSEGAIADGIWKAIQGSLKEGWLLGCSSSLAGAVEAEVADTGILARHTYAFTTLPLFIVKLFAYICCHSENPHRKCFPSVFFRPNIIGKPHSHTQPLGTERVEGTLV